MGRPTDFAEANACLGAPHGCETEVVALPIRRDGQTLVSCWQLSDAEIEEVRATGLVWLSVWGARTQPPVLVTGHKHEVA